MVNPNESVWVSPESCIINTLSQVVLKVVIGRHSPTGQVARGTLPQPLVDSHTLEDPVSTEGNQTPQRAVSIPDYVYKR